MKFWSVIITVFFVLRCVNSWSQSSEDAVKVKNVSWLERFSDTFYKIFYVLLMTGIIFCALYNFVKNKFGKKVEGKGWTVDNSREMDDYSKILSLLETPTKTSLTENERSEYLSNYSESDNRLRQRLRQTQEEIQSLRNHLTLSIDNKTELESTLAMIDKEKMSTEMQLELERVQGVLELEKIKKDNLLVKREIQKLLEEKDQAVREVERLDRDVKISRSAVVDTEFLEERLLSVRKEADALKQQFLLLAEEKENASSVIVDSSTHPSNRDIDLECSASWSGPDFVQEYMTLD